MNEWMNGFVYLKFKSQIKFKNLKLAFENWKYFLLLESCSAWIKLKSLKSPYGKFTFIFKLKVSDNVYLFTSTSLACQQLDMVNIKCNEAPELDLPPAMVNREHHITVKAGDNLYTLSKQGVCIFNSKNLSWQYFCHCKFLLKYTLSVTDYSTVFL